ncbi:FadR/GntR family transcriptional regulator [Ornithinibacillus halophilus]|uniref:GntR family transcriptional regulator, transcriptional repressor for pyruvate dehydrogenase complex n=1 Tax=Ornithinibacillus halophilus TaxID=930117 RepID=A0A1M5EGN7_9BACI|nr:GntR family transcriptional regulator [Ornithinibacillus halophilus]SHF78356.1 GntR family transcriptional regulator, transcriptional repressor for pyruvate dehydrogenase complex [Ornithinibacillus halophilus]
MAVSMSPKQKVYQGVLQELRKFIEVNHLKAGDKLPSERELAETLQAGRSSVREALRAMELLGLIETRHGEGTFLSSYRPLQTVEILASFILQETTTRDELVLVKNLLEKEAAKLAYENIDEGLLEKLSSIINQESKEWNNIHDEFFTFIFKITGNQLFTKIWKLIEGYSHAVNQSYYEESFYQNLIQAYRNQNYELIEQLFNQELEN